jgi:hypothetical protein
MLTTRTPLTPSTPLTPLTPPPFPASIPTLALTPLHPPIPHLSLRQLHRFPVRLQNFTEIARMSEARVCECNRVAVAAKVPVFEVGECSACGRELASTETEGRIQGLRVYEWRIGWDDWRGVDRDVVLGRDCFDVVFNVVFDVVFDVGLGFPRSGSRAGARGRTRWRCTGHLAVWRCKNKQLVVVFCSVWSSSHFVGVDDDGGFECIGWSVLRPIAVCGLRARPIGQLGIDSLQTAGGCRIDRLERVSR